MLGEQPGACRAGQDSSEVEHTHPAQRPPPIADLDHGLRELAHSLTAFARELFDAMRCPKTFVQFTAADGAAQHCEQLNRTFALRTMLDWLDETLA